jgi:UDP-N-acetylmuramoylalanine-D-glutamate ligase
LRARERVDKSFDMFKDYEDRGNQFKALVRERFAA